MPSPVVEPLKKFISKRSDMVKSPCWNQFYEHLTIKNDIYTINRLFKNTKHLIDE